MKELFQQVIQHLLQEKSYCGKKCSVPSGYTRMGTRYQCLRKGVNVGKNMDLSARKITQDIVLFLH
jgi:hypothetical protein